MNNHWQKAVQNRCIMFFACCNGQYTVTAHSRTKTKGVMTVHRPLLDLECRFEVVGFIQSLVFLEYIKDKGY